MLLRLQGLLEFWFSDANLSRDKFLSGKVAGGGADGWVSLCTVAAFKKVLVVLAAPRKPQLRTCHFTYAARLSVHPVELRD